MPIVGMGITKIEAVRHVPVTGKVGIGQKPLIKDIRPKKIEAVGKDGFEIEFEYTFEYKDTDKKKDLASIMFAGEVIYLPKNEEEGKAMMEKWKKDKKISVDIFLPVMNGIIRRCVARGIWLSEELGLPSPIRFPRVTATKKEEASRYIG